MATPYYRRPLSARASGRWTSSGTPRVASYSRDHHKRVPPNAPLPAHVALPLTSHVALLLGRALRDIVVLLIQAVILIAAALPFRLNIDLHGVVAIVSEGCPESLDPFHRPRERHRPPHPPGGRDQWA
jgi:hypothetical protein